jgi:hypothetical protein
MNLCNKSLLAAQWGMNLCNKSLYASERGMNLCNKSLAASQWDMILDNKSHWLLHSDAWAYATRHCCNNRIQKFLPTPLNRQKWLNLVFFRNIFNQSIYQVFCRFRYQKTTLGTLPWSPYNYNLPTCAEWLDYQPREIQSRSEQKPRICKNSKMIK